MKTEEYVLQFAETHNHDYLEVDGKTGTGLTSLYMSDVGHYDSLKLAELAVEAFNQRHKNERKIRILRVTMEEVKIV